MLYRTDIPYPDEKNTVFNNHRKINPKADSPNIFKAESFFISFTSQKFVHSLQLMQLLCHRGVDKNQQSINKKYFILLQSLLVLYKIEQEGVQ